MKRHRFDLVSLVLGVILVPLGIVAIAGELGTIINEPVAAIPIAFGLVGLALIVSARRWFTDPPPPSAD